MADTRPRRPRSLLAPGLGLLLAASVLTGCGDAASEVESTGDVEVLVADAAAPTIDLPGEGELGIGDAVRVGGGGVEDGSGAGLEVPASCRDRAPWLASGE